MTTVTKSAVYAKSNDETMTEARVYLRESGEYVVALFDSESAETVPMFTIFRDVASAISFADSLVAR